MNNEKTPKTITITDKHLKRGGFALGMAAVALGGALTFSAISAPKPVELRLSDSSKPYPSASAMESATPRPSEAGASPSPEASKAPETVKIETFHLVPGDKFEAKSGDVVIGDVAMSDTDSASNAVFLFDTDTKKADGKDNTKTGMLVDVQKDGFVLAPYGGDVIRGLQGEKKSTWVELKKAEMENGGCVGGCTDGVDVVQWTGADTTVPQSGMKSEGAVNSANPSEAPTLSGTTLDEKKQELLTIMDSEAFKSLSSEDRAKVLLALIECMCAGPVATPEPTVNPSPTPSATPEANCDTANDHLMKAGETFRVNGKDFIVQGDVLIDGKKHYDNSEKTGAIDWITDGRNHTIKAPYGADVQVFCATATDKTENDLYSKDLEQLKGSGRTLDKNSLKN